MSSNKSSIVSCTCAIAEWALGRMPNVVISVGKMPCRTPVSSTKSRLLPYTATNSALPELKYSVNCVISVFLPTISYITDIL